MASTVVYVKLEPIAQRLIEFVEEITSYIDSHDADDDLIELCAQLGYDLEWLRIQQALDDPS